MDLERFPFISKIRQNIRIFYSYAHAQHAHIVTMCMLSISIVLLLVCSAYAYCYYACAQYKHSNSQKCGKFMRMLSIRVVTLCLG